MSSQKLSFIGSSMSTQRLDLPSCTTATFTRNNKDHHHHQPLRPVGLSVDQKHIEAKTSTCSLKQHIRLPPLAITAAPSPLVEDSIIKDNTNNNKSLKRLAAEHQDDSFTNNIAKRKKKSSSTKDKIWKWRFWFNLVTVEGSFKLQYLWLSDSRQSQLQCNEKKMDLAFKKHVYWII